MPHTHARQSRAIANVVNAQATRWNVEVYYTDDIIQSFPSKDGAELPKRRRQQTQATTAHAWALIDRYRFRRLAVVRLPETPKTGMREQMRRRRRSPLGCQIRCCALDRLFQRRRWVRRRTVRHRPCRRFRRHSRRRRPDSTVEMNPLQREQLPSQLWQGLRYLTKHTVRNVSYRLLLHVAGKIETRRRSEFECKKRNFNRMATINHRIYELYVIYRPTKMK